MKQNKLKTINNLWSHQKEAFHKWLGSPDRTKFALFFEQGTGKTLTAISMLHTLKNVYTKFKTLILTPNESVTHNWEEELKGFKLNPNTFPIMKGVGPSKKRIEILEKKRPNTFITAYTSLINKDLFKALKEYKFDVIIFDESHYLKNPTSKRTKHSIVLSDIASHKFILTGTPVLNDSIADFHQQIRVLDPKILGHSKKMFMLQYFDVVGVHNPNEPNQYKQVPIYVPKKGAFEIVTNKIAPFSVRAEKKDCLDLPPLIKKVQFVEMTAKEKRVYLEMEKHFISECNDSLVVAEMAVSKSRKLHQISNGYFIDEFDQTKSIETDILNSPRAKVLKDLLQVTTEFGKKVLVWAVYKHHYEVIRQVCNSLKLGFSECTGESKNKQEEIDRFKTDKKCQVFIGHPRSAGIGINLVEAETSIFYSRSYSIEEDMQTEARNYRGGSDKHEKIIRYDIVTKDSIDELIYNSVKNKIKVSESIMNFIKEKA